MYKHTCPQGHVSYNIVQEQKFELLFANGCHAILDEYYREAISSFASSLERFYEYFINLVCIKTEIEKNARIEIWKNVSNQSERQFGAFLYLWSIEFGQKPSILSQSNITYRNSVIHKGEFPTKENTVCFGQAVLTLLHEYLEQIKNTHKEEIIQSVFEHQKKATERIPENMPQIVSSQDTGIRLSTSVEEEEKTLEDLLESAKFWHEQFKA